MPTVAQIQQLGLLYAEAAVWSGATSNVILDELVSHGYYDEIDPILTALADSMVPEYVRDAAQAVAEKMMQSLPLSTIVFLGVPIVPLVPCRDSYSPNVKKFRAAGQAFTTLINTVAHVIICVPNGRRLCEMGKFFVNPEVEIPDSPPEPKPEKGATMKIDMTAVSPDTVPLKTLLPGEVFMHAGSIYILGQAIVSEGKFRTTGGEVMLFAFSPASGLTTTFDPNTGITPVEATLKVEKFKE